MIKKAMQPPVCAPKVEGFMLKPVYWIEKIRAYDCQVKEEKIKIDQPVKVVFLKKGGKKWN